MGKVGSRIDNDLLNKSMHPVFHFVWPRAARRYLEEPTSEREYNIISFRRSSNINSGGSGAW